MSTLKVEIVKVKTVEKAPNSDFLDCVTFENMDWIVIAGREKPELPRYKPSDLVVYIPIDSVLPPKLEGWLFPPGSKIVLSNSRIKTIKIRGCISQGMSISLDSGIIDQYPEMKGKKLGDDVTKILGITKYEPPESSTPSHMKATSKKKSNPHFHQYTDIDNFKHYPDIFEGLKVSITEKLHGSSARYACLPKKPKNVWEHILKFFKLLPEYEFCFGSRRVQLQDKPKNHKGFYEDNIYGIIAEQLNLKNILQPGEALYGEIVGHGIQKGYSYGCKPGEYKFFAYDVQIISPTSQKKYLDPYNFGYWCGYRRIDIVPELYVGKWDKETINALRTGDSRIGNQKIREGIVIKPTVEFFHPRIGRAVLKWINDEYLLKDQTDFH
jgi:RNA ligase (TIGR02306 family)